MGLLSHRRVTCGECEIIVTVLLPPSGLVCVCGTDHGDAQAPAIQQQQHGVLRGDVAIGLNDAVLEEGLQNSIVHPARLHTQ